jgi:5-methylcytosine-specific restriction endonuclease McrA
LPRGHKRDLSATQDAGFLDPRSFISRDGGLFLYGKDWGPHREKLFIRTRGQCEQMTFVGSERNPLSTKYTRCVHAINLDSMESHHVIERKDGGSDDLSNLLGICRPCHQRAHAWRQPRFGEHK